MTSTIETTTDRLAVGDIVAVVDTDGDHLWAVENSIGVVVEVDPGPKTAYDLIGVRQGNGNITKMYAFRLRKLVPGDRVRVSYSESCDGQAVVTGVWSDHSIIHAKMETGKLAGVTGGFFPKDLFFIEAAPEGKQPIPHGTHSNYGQNVYGFAVGDKALAAGASAKATIGKAVTITGTGHGDGGWVFVEAEDGTTSDVWLSHLEPLPEPVVEPVQELPRDFLRAGDRLVSIADERTLPGWQGLATVNNPNVSGYIDVTFDNNETGLLLDDEIDLATIHEPGFKPGDRVVYTGNHQGGYFEPEVIGATGTVTKDESDDTTTVQWDAYTERTPSSNVFTINLSSIIEGELVAEPNAIPTVADLAGFAAVNNEGTVLRSTETGYVYGKQGGRWLQLGSTGDASWTVVKAVEVGKHFQVLSS